MEMQMLDVILLPELKKQYAMLERIERNLTPEEKKEKHKVFSVHGEQILSLADIARKEGLLALDEAGEKIDDVQEKELLKALIILIVDGTDPEMVGRLALMKYFSKKQGPYSAIINIMSIYGMLSIQAGENPGLIQEMMRNIIPGDVSEPTQQYWEKIEVEVTKKEVDIESLCLGKIRVKEGDKGYFELSLCEELLLVMDNRSIQRVLRDLNDHMLSCVMKAFSGDARKCIFQNLSGRKAEELAKYIRFDDMENETAYYIDDSWSLEHVKDAAIEMLKLIHHLEMTGEIVIVKGELLRFLTMIMQQIAYDEKALKERKHDCDLLIRMLESYRRYTFGNYS